MSHAVAVDIGGTFTDLVAFDHDSHTVIYTKSPTTYDNFVAGIADCFAKAKISPRDVTLVNHGTTLVINALIQRRGGRAALITTKGFRDIIEIARGNRPDPFDLHYQRDEPLIPRELRFEIGERIDGEGMIVEPLDVEGLGRLAAELRDLKLDGVAVFFLNSYANPTHEEAAAALLKRLLPGVFVTASTELSREWYEYERTATVAANAYVGADVNAYVRRLDGDLRSKGFSGRIFMMGFAHMANVKLLHVPYRGMGPALIDLTAGRLQLAFVGLPPIKSSLDTGALKALAVAQSSRLKAAQTIPSADEAGLSGFEFITWFGVVTTGRTPAANVAKLNAAIGTILKKPAIEQRLSDFGMEALVESPSDFAARMRKDYEKYGALIKAAQIKVE